MVSSKGIKLLPWRFLQVGAYRGIWHVLLKKSPQLSLGSCKVSTSCPSCPLARKRCHLDARNPDVQFQKGLGLWPARRKGPSALQGGGMRAQYLSSHGVALSGQHCGGPGDPWVLLWPQPAPAEQREHGAPHREGVLCGDAVLIARRAESWGFSKCKAPFDLC